MNMCVFMGVRASSNVYVCKCMYVRTCVYVSVRACTCACVRACTRVRIRAYACVCITQRVCRIAKLVYCLTAGNNRLRLVHDAK